MPTTVYTQVDFTNIITLTSAFVSSSNVGTIPNMTASGLDAAGFTLANPVPPSAGAEVRAFARYQFDLNHSTPSTPIPADAEITQIKITQQVTNASAATSCDSTFTNPGNNGHSDVASDVHVLLNQNNPTWITADNSIDNFEFDSGSGGGTQNLNKNAGPVSRLIQVVYNITALPGPFPDGFMTKAAFVAAFTTLVVEYNIDSVAGSVRGTDNDATGSYSTGIDITAINLQIEVEWTAPVSTTWTVTPTTLTLPDNEITISRPVDENFDPDQTIEKIFIGDDEILPDDPWVILWTDYEIIVHLPPDIPPLPDVDVIFAGIQFSGRVNLITLTINTADLSGIYEFDITAHHDTLYDRTVVPTTQNVKIPAPFLVTYFVGDEEFNVMHFAGTRVRAQGQGIIHQVLQSYDYIRTIQFGDETLRTSNNISEFSLTDFVEQKASLRIYMDTYDDYMNISNIIIFAKPLYTGYPK